MASQTSAAALQVYVLGSNWHVSEQQLLLALGPGPQSHCSEPPTIPSPQVTLHKVLTPTHVPSTVQLLVCVQLL